MIRTRISPIELLWDHRAPVVEEIGADGDDESRRLESEAWPRSAVRLAVGRDCSVIGLRIVAQMRRHSIIPEPRVEETREASRLVLVYEDGVASLAPATHRTELLRENLQRLIPGHALQSTILSRH